MSPEEISERGVYRFSGPPENWITAIKFMTWGLEDKHLNYWQKIEPGDIFIMHSMKTNSIVRDATYSAVGFGVVSPDFNKKNHPLWLAEIRERKNIWPLLVPFSEIYLFSELRPQDSLIAPNGTNNDLIIQESLELLSSAVPLTANFPHMGSMSSVKPEDVVDVLKRAERFYLYSSVGQTKESLVKTPALKRIDSADQIKVRKPATLKQLDIVKKKTIKKGTITFTTDLRELEKADNAHQATLKMLVDLLKSYGYELYSEPRSVDLFAKKDNHSFLFEVKSLSNKNFREQARSGIVQLFEYEYFEIRRFFEDNNLKDTTNKVLIFSEGPTDQNYISFVNNLNISAGFFSEHKLKASGQSSKLAGLTTLSNKP